MALNISPSYYDKVLAAIAVSLSGGAVVGVISSYPFQAGLLAGALVATVWIYDAMFRNPPTPSLSTQAKFAAVVWHGFLGFLFLQIVL